MPGINLYTSNRMEILVEKLSAVVSQPHSSVFTPEIIIVQSNGMERWISMQLAGKLGIWANCKYLFPNKAIEEIFQIIIPEAGQGRIFKKDIITWQIMKILKNQSENKAFGFINEYLAGGSTGFRNYQLCSRIADLFDQYLTFRPDMILNWEKGKYEKDNWQAVLWLMLMEEVKIQHPPELRKIFFERIRNKDSINGLENLPERISVFGISTLPVYHLEIFAGISEYTDVNIFFMNPAKEYWSDIHTGRNIAEIMADYNDPTAAGLHLEKGNPLLASMGKTGGDFLANLMNYNIADHQEFVEAGQDSILHCIQSDILNMTDRNALNKSTDRGNASFDGIKDIKSDNSVKICSCHNILREIEILYDNILDAFENSGYEPRDILVMTPDIELYSPYINAVFSRTLNGQAKIPYSITDMTLRREAYIDAFFAIIDLLGSRFEASRVLDILEFSAVRNKFNFSVNDISVVRTWIRETNISWGIDSGHRGMLGLPEYNENSWNAGIDRILLGYAMYAHGNANFNGIFPNNTENDSELLGKFAEFFHILKDIYKKFADLYSLREWSAILSGIIDSLMEETDSEDYMLLTYAVKKLEEIGQSAYADKTDREAVIEFLEEILKEKRITSGFITGGVAFCTMLPMRSIPFKMICLIGMNDSSFPRQNKTMSFDMIAGNPRRGDRSARDDDRYIFLESVVSARDRFYISYIGQSIRDNSEIPPSVLVSELIDYIETGFPNNEHNVKDIIHIKHPLHSFSPRYFTGDEDLFTYSGSMYNAVLKSLSERKENEIFIKGKLSDQFDYGSIIHFNDLISFYSNPAGFLLRKKLGIILDEADDLPDEHEPFSIKGLEKYHLEDILCGYVIEGKDPDLLFDSFRGHGQLPHGELGRQSFNNLLPGIKNFSSAVRKDISGRSKKIVEFKISISEHTVQGALDNIWPEKMIYYRYADVKPRDRLRAWIRHLALNALDESGIPKTTRLICKDSVWEMPLINPQDILYNLLNIFIKGMNELIYFFPETSFAYAGNMINKGNHDEALRKAENAWKGNEFVPGEGADAYNYLVFKDINPLSKEFADVSMKVYRPMLENQEKIK